MTTPKRYEEMAEDLAKGVVRLSDSLSTPYVDKRRIANALRTAAREAQVRALDAALAVASKYAVSYSGAIQRGIEDLLSRAENGEDL